MKINLIVLGLFSLFLYSCREERFKQEYIKLPEIGMVTNYNYKCNLEIQINNTLTYDSTYFFNNLWDKLTNYKEEYSFQLFEKLRICGNIDSPYPPEPPISLKTVFSYEKKEYGIIPIEYDSVFVTELEKFDDGSVRLIESPKTLFYKINLLDSTIIYISVSYGILDYFKDENTYKFTIDTVLTNLSLKELKKKKVFNTNFVYKQVQVDKVALNLSIDTNIVNSTYNKRDFVDKLIKNIKITYH